MAEEYGKIRKSLMVGIADAIREKNGSSDTYTPADMAGAILSIESGTPMMFSSAAIGILPEVVKGTANTTFTLDFTSSAVGILQEG